jgi:phasin family protein
MYQTPEQLIALNKSNVDAAMRLAGVALQSVEKLVGLQMETAKAAFAESANSVRALTAVKDPQDLVALQERILQPSLDKASTYARNVYGVAASAQSELNKLIETQIADFNKSAITALDKAAANAPAGAEFAVAAMRSAVASANLAFDNVSKVAKQFADVTDANVATATKATAAGKKKSA